MSMEGTPGRGLNMDPPTPEPEPTPEPDPVPNGYSNEGNVLQQGPASDPTGYGVRGPAVEVDPLIAANTEKADPKPNRRGRPRKK